MRPRLFLSGDATYPLHHPLAAVEDELLLILGGDFELALCTEHFETLEAPDYEAFDCVLLYNDHWIDKSPTVHQQVQALLHYVALGGGLLVLHNLGPGVDWEMAQLLGGRLKDPLSPPRLQTVRYVPADTDHPILRGVGAFTLEDELFDIQHDGLTEKTVLLNARLENGIEIPMAWAVEFGMGRAVYISPGHGKAAFGDPEYGKLLRGGALWAAKRI